MPYISNLHNLSGTQVVCARPGDHIDTCIEMALQQVAQPGKAYSYFDHNGVITRVDKGSTHETAYAAWNAALHVECEATMAIEEGAAPTPNIPS